MLSVSPDLARSMSNGNPSIALYIDPPWHHFVGDRLFDPSAHRYGGDQLFAPYVSVREFFAARGIPVHTADYLPREVSDVRNVYISMGMLRDYRRLSQRPDVVLSAFFALECPVADPSLFRTLGRIQDYFNRIYSWSDSRALEPFVGRPLRCQPFRWPQPFNAVHEEIWSRTGRKLLCMVAANKLPRLYWQELYTERLKAIEFFSRTGEFDLYGTLWDRPSLRVGKTWIPWTIRRTHWELLHRWHRVRPDPFLEAARRVYRGTAECKRETLGNYTFSLCFENSILKGWVTERLFDCFFSGTIPIYWGAPDIEAYVPRDCFIDMRCFSGYPELWDYLKSLSEREIREYKVKAREYLSSPQYRPFTKETFVELFARIVQEDTGVQW